MKGDLAMQKCIIERAKTKPPTDVQKRIAFLDRTFTLSSPPAYRNTERGEDYHFLAGGAAAPRGLMPGYAVVIAVVKVEEGQPLFHVLEEVQEKDLRVLMKRCVQLEERYGYRLSEELFRPWHGDFQAYSQIIADFNDELEDEKGNRFWGFYPSPPAFPDESVRLQVYLNLIGPLLDRSNKRLFLGPADILRNALTNTLIESSLKWTADACPPPILALGHVVYALVQMKPWLRRIPRTIDLSRVGDYEEWEIYAGFAPGSHDGKTIGTVE
jgi:hypothetical protein